MVAVNGTNHSGSFGSTCVHNARRVDARLAGSASRAEGCGRGEPRILELERLKRETCERCARGVDPPIVRVSERE